MKTIQVVRKVTKLGFLVGVFLLGWTLLGSRLAQAAPQGFQLNLFEPTASGEWSLFVDHPWYSSMRYFSGGITLDYAHDPLPYAVRDPGSDDQIRFPGPVLHQFVGHVDLAGSFLDRVLITFSLPITFYEAAGTTNPIELAGVIASNTVAVGDPRLGVMVRIVGQPYKDAFSLSGGAELWFPINSLTQTFAPQEAESGWRFRVKAALGGLSHHVLWSFLVGYYYRPDGFLGDTEDRVYFRNFRSGQFQLGAAIAYASYDKRFSIGPEALFSTVVANDLDAAAVTAFQKDHSSLELLLGIHYNIASQVQLSVGGGVGLLRDVGTPDGRVLFRLSYAPIRKEPVKPTPVKLPKLKPMPADRDGDGVVDTDDKCPDVAQGANPDPDRKGCPAPVKTLEPKPEEPKVEISDRDGDGIPDEEDACPKDKGPRETQGCPKIKNIEVTGEKIKISGKIQFATGKAKIEKVSAPLLDAVVTALQMRPKLRLRIEGHTDNKGKPAKNLRLSEQRADAVRKYLVQHGIAEDRLSAEGFGDTRPIADNKKAKGRDQNRRTEFMIAH